LLSEGRAGAAESGRGEAGGGISGNGARSRAYRRSRATEQNPCRPRAEREAKLTAVSVVPRGDVIIALHLGKPRHGALELEGAITRGIEPLRRRGSRADEIAMRLIERVDEDVEALGLVALLGHHARDALDHKGVIARNEGEIIRRSQGLAAELVERHPGDALGRARHDNLASEHWHHRLAR